VRLNERHNVTPLRFALSAEPGIIEMNPTAEKDGQTSIGTGGDRAEARTLDSFGFSNVSLIKIDVEVHEAQVSRGARETIRRCHPVILLEIWQPSLVKVMLILKEFGYTVEKVQRLQLPRDLRGLKRSLELVTGCPWKRSSTHSSTTAGCRWADRAQPVLDHLDPVGRRPL
jgi:hypothetical protein